MDKSVEGGLKSIGNSMSVQRNPPENREQLQKINLILSLFMQPGPGNKSTPYFNPHNVTVLFSTNITPLAG